MKKQLVLLVLSALAAGVAQAADGLPITANLSLTSNYKYRGQDQGNNKPAIQGGFDWTGGGLYVGNWNSSIGFTNAGIEMDFYGGYRGEVAPGVGFDVGVLQYYYPQKSKLLDFNTTELYGAVSYSILTLKYSHTVSKDYFALGEAAQLLGGGPRPKGRNTGYLDLSANVELAKGITLNGHLGYTSLSDDLKDVGYPSYTDYKLGLTYDAGSGFLLSGAVAGANKKDFYGDINKARLILTLTKSM